MDGKETAGQGPVIKKSEDWVADKTFHGETVRGPFYNAATPDQFVVYFTLDVTPKATGQRITLEEVGVYTVNKNDKGKGADLIQIAQYIPAALLGRAVGDPVRALDKCRLGAPVPLRPSLLPCTGAGAVPDFPADR